MLPNERYNTSCVDGNLFSVLLCLTQRDEKPKKTVIKTSVSVKWDFFVQLLNNESTPLNLVMSIVQRKTKEDKNVLESSRSKHKSVF